MTSTATTSYMSSESAYAHVSKATWRRISTERGHLNTSSGPWSEREHLRFLDGVRLFPNGPWRLVADYVGTRTVRQVQTHHQKIIERTRRHNRGLLKKRKPKADHYPSSPTLSTSSSSCEEQPWAPFNTAPDLMEFPMWKTTGSTSGFVPITAPDNLNLPECDAEDLICLLDILSDDFAIV